MNEERTKDLSDRRSFEERVFARFDSVDARLGILESRGFDTKPIWQNALKAIMEMGLEVSEVKRKIAVIETDVAGMRIDYVGLRSDITGVKTDITGLKTDVAAMKTDVTAIKTDVATVKTDVATIKTHVVAIKTDYVGLRNGLTEMKRELKHVIDETLDLILKFLLEDRENIRDANDRISQLETKLA